MTNLTEQWKKGELPLGDYYIKLWGGEITTDTWDIDGWQYFNKKGDEVVEVLAPVPSYEEWDILNNACHELEKETACLTVDIVKLKELLKEVLRHELSLKEISELTRKISEVLK